MTASTASLLLHHHGSTQPAEADDEEEAFSLSPISLILATVWLLLLSLLLSLIEISLVSKIKESLDRGESESRSVLSDFSAVKANKLPRLLEQKTKSWNKELPLRTI